MCVQPPPEENLPEVAPSGLPATQWNQQQWEPMQLLTKGTQNHQCPPHFIQTPSVEDVSFSKKIIKVIPSFLF